MSTHTAPQRYILLNNTYQNSPRYYVSKKFPLFCRHFWLPTAAGRAAARLPHPASHKSAKYCFLNWPRWWYLNLLTPWKPVTCWMPDLKWCHQANVKESDLFTQLQNQTTCSEYYISRRVCFYNFCCKVWIVNTKKNSLFPSAVLNLKIESIKK